MLHAVGWGRRLVPKEAAPLQDLEQQLEDLTQQMQNSTESVHVKELESERRLAEERIAELESQLTGDQRPASTAESGAVLVSLQHNKWDS